MKTTQPRMTYWQFSSFALFQLYLTKHSLSTFKHAALKKKNWPKEKIYEFREECGGEK